MPGKTEVSRVQSDPEAIQSQLRLARELMDRGCLSESLIQYLQALENSLVALQQKLGMFHEFLVRRRSRSRKQVLQLNRDLLHDLNRLKRNYIKKDPSTLH
ncbi:MAG: hypothetical protein JRI57_00145 [Deltaproteobacteria bacterium]|nr:hypothetical protein [Deltaproteobacteria bacterium]